MKTLTSNLQVTGKNVSITPKPEVQEVANRLKPSHGAPSRGVHRTWERILEKLREHFAENPFEAGEPGKRYLGEVEATA